MMIRKYENSFYYDIFYFLLIFLLAAGASCQNIAIAQTANQQLSYDSTEPFSLVFPLDPEGRATVNYSFQQNNLFAFVYGKSNLKVLDLETENIIYEISYPGSSIYNPYLMDDYLIYTINSGLNDEVVRVDLSSEGLETIRFPGTFRQVTDDGHLIIFNHDICQLIEPEEGQILFEPEVSGGGKILCVDDVIVFPIVDNYGNPTGYKAMSTNGEVKFFLEEIFNEVRIFLPDYRSEISTFPLPILICNHYLDPNEKQWLLKFINKERQTIASYSPADLGIEYTYGSSSPTSLKILDEDQDKCLFRIRYDKEGEDKRFAYILADSSGSILKIFDENVFDETNHSAFDHQGNILLFQNRDGSLRDILNYYQQDGTQIFSKKIPTLIPSGWPREFKFLGMDAILGYEYNQFEKYSLTNGELTGIYPISTDYQIYNSNTVVFNNQVYFFARPRGGVEPPIPGSNLFSFSTADSGWLDIELVSIRPNAGTTYEVWDNTEVKVRFRTEYGSNFGKDLLVDFEKGEVLAVNPNHLEYTWHTPTIVSGSQDTAKITVSYGPVSQEFIITIKDYLPTASFAFDPISPQTEQNVRFDASLSSDLDGEINAYHWDFGDGTIGQEEEQDYIDHIFSVMGEYPVTLSVTDNNGQTATVSKNIRVTAAPKPPVANFKLLDPSTQWDTKVRFDGSLSSDPDGSIVSYRWDFGDGTIGEGVNVSHEYPQLGGFFQGVYEVTLAVTDNQNLSTGKVIPITVGHILSYDNKGNIGIPAALRNDDNTVVDYQIEVTTGSVSEAGTDSWVYLALFGPEKANGRYGSGELNPYNALDALRPFEKGNTDNFVNQGYNLDDVEFMTLRHNNHYDKPGWYVETVKVKNASNGKEWLFVPDQWLAMNEPPEHQTWGKFVPVEPPVAELSYSPTNPFVGEMVSFDGSSSSDPDGTIVSYRWDFENMGSGSGGRTYSSTFMKAGTYTVTLTVTDDEGLSGTTTKSFMVKKNLIGDIKAIIEWAWDSPVDISLPYASENSINVLQSDTGTTPYFHVDWEIKDNSSTLGYPLYVASELKSYDFSTWNWVMGETEGHTKTGNNTRWGKYNNSGTWSLNPLQPNPVTKYKLTLTGKSYNESKEKSEEFYAALPIPEDFNSSFAAARIAAPKWIAGRYELALLFRTMSQYWNNIKNSSLSAVNYREETERILGSTHCLFGSTTAEGCATNLGLDFLKVAASVAGNVALSGASAVAQPLNMAYTYITLEIDTLSWAADHWDDIMNELSISSMGNTPAANELKLSLEALFPAILDEANEAVEFAYNNASDNEWYTKLQTEKNKLNDVAVKALSVYDNAKPIFIADGTSDAENDVLEFLDLIKEMANFQAGILEAALSDQ